MSIDINHSGYNKKELYAAQATTSESTSILICPCLGFVVCQHGLRIVQGMDGWHAVV